MLRTGIIVRNLLPSLRPLLTEVEYFRVMGREENVSQVDELVRILRTKENRHFDGFCKALEENGYEHLARKLKKGIGTGQGEQLI